MLGGLRVKACTFKLSGDDRHVLFQAFVCGGEQGEPILLYSGERFGGVDASLIQDTVYGII